MRFSIKSKKLQKVTPAGMQWRFIRGHAVLMSANTGAGSGGLGGKAKQPGPGESLNSTHKEYAASQIRASARFLRDRTPVSVRFTEAANTPPQGQVINLIGVVKGTPRELSQITGDKLPDLKRSPNATGPINMTIGHRDGRDEPSKSLEFPATVKPVVALTRPVGTQGAIPVRAPIQPGSIKQGAPLGKPASTSVTVNPTIGSGSGSTHKTEEGRAAMSLKMKQVFSDPAMKARIAEGRKKAAEARAKALEQRK